MAFIVDPDRAAHSFDGGRVNFYAEENGKRVLCAVTDEAIQDLTRSTTLDPDELVELFQGNSLIFGEIAEEKYREGLLGEDGFVVVKSEDLERHD